MQIGRLRGLARAARDPQLGLGERIAAQQQRFGASGVLGAGRLPAVGQLGEARVILDPDAISEQHLGERCGLPAKCLARAARGVHVSVNGRRAFFDSRHKAFREARQAAYREVRAEYKPRWVEHFGAADGLRKEAEHGAAAVAVKVLHHAAKGEFEIAWDLLSDREALSRNAEDEIAEARRQLRDQQRAETRQRQDEACAALYHERASAYAEIKQCQKQERAELRDLQGARSAAEPYDKDRLIELVAEPAFPTFSTRRS